MSAFHLVRRSDRTAVSTFKRVVRSPMCVFGKARIPQRYLNLLRDRFEYLLYYETDGRVDGFLVGGRDVVTVDGRKTTVFYVDVVCSQYRKGRMLLLQAEVIGQRLRCEAVALRALPHVIRYYRKLGYQTALNACHAESRRQAEPPENRAQPQPRQRRHLDDQVPGGPAPSGRAKGHVDQA